MRWLGSCTVLLMLLLGLGRAEASVTLLNGYNYTRVYDVANNLYPSDTPPDDLAIPYSLDVVASTDTGHAITHVSRTQSSFDYEFDHVRPTSQSSYVESYGYSQFTVDQDTPYAVSGNYNLTGSEGVYFFAYLWDSSTGDKLYDYHYSNDTANATFTLGSPVDSENYYSVGSLTGLLEAGHTYGFSYTAFIQANTTGDTTASAVGSISLAFGSVPEPST
jgi:hypothetical protein